MDVQIQKVSKKDKSVLSNLLEYYLYDFSEYEQTDVNRHGLFGYSYMDHYFTDKNRHAYFVLADGNYAGFVLIHDQTLLKDTDMAIAEFFIMRNYRRKGIGRTVLHNVLKEYSGIIEVPVSDKNQNGLKFWESMFNDPDHIIETTIESSADWDGPIFKIQN